MPKKECQSPFIFKAFFLLVFLPFLGIAFPAQADDPLSQVPAYGGRLVLGVASDPKSFNDIMAKETSSTVITNHIFEGLTRLDAETLKMIPHLAESWKILDDGKKWIFTLRKDVFWSDGEPFTADDVVFTFNDLIYNDSIPSSARDIFSIDGEQFLVEKIDDYHVSFTLPVKFAPFLRGMAQPILPRHKLKTIVDKGKFNFAWGIDVDPKEVVGTGPYMLKHYYPGERVVLERNPNYWQVAPSGNRLPYIEQIIYMIVPNTDVLILKFIEGEVDACGVRGNDFPYLKPLEEKGNFVVYKAGADFGANFLVFNQNQGISPKTHEPYVEPKKLRWFKNLQFRRAIAHAIDKKKMIEILMNGLGYPQKGPMSPSSGYFYSDKTIAYKYDLDLARKILYEAGFEDRNNDGIIEDKEGNPVKFNLYTNSGNPIREQIAAIIRHDLQELGMQVNYLSMEFNTLVSKLNATFDWDAIIIGLTGGIDPHFGKNVWDSSGQLHMWYPKQSQPATAWEARIDEIFSLGVQELDEKKRKVLYDEFQQIVSRELPFIFTVLGANMFAVRNKFGNLRPTSYGGAFHNLEEIFIYPEYIK